VALKVALKVDLKLAVMVVFNRVQKQVFALSCHNNYMNPSIVYVMLKVALKMDLKVALMVVCNASA